MSFHIACRSDAARMLLMTVTAFMGCVAFEPPQQSIVDDFEERPCIAVLEFGFDIELTELSAVQTVDRIFSPEEEALLLANALQRIRQDARWLLLSRLATGHGFRFVPSEAVDALADELQLKPGQIPKAEQLREFRRRLGADLVVSGSLLDYGKVRWQWLLTGMLVDMTVDNTLIGLATGWNPIALAASVGWDVLTSAPIWFGGGYLFGVAFRPVRVEARAFETLQGYPIWQTMEEAVYAWSALKMLPEEIRRRKEVQLHLNLAEIMESMGDNLTGQNLSRSSCCEGRVR
jgi:nucleotide-binding universal stress UspA family protein